jgi:calcineurin-like phosphoesterase family protein
MIDQVRDNELDEEYDDYIEYEDRIETNSRNTFVTSDQHLGHYNIIKYCNRPFETLDEMNETLIANWNNTIKPNDTVFFLGDLAFGKNSKTDHWINQLNGNIIFFRGNHDASSKIQFFTSAIVTFGEIPFYLTHDPYNVPDTWRGWIIHGHHHNNIPDRYPFIHHRLKTVNVSVELTRYAPVNINTILKLINPNR